MVILVSRASPTPLPRVLVHPDTSIAIKHPSLTKPFNIGTILVDPTPGIKLAATQSPHPMPESADLSVLPPPSLHHNATPKINNSTWNARRHLKLNLNLSQQTWDFNHFNNHHNNQSHHSPTAGHGGGCCGMPTPPQPMPYNNKINLPGRSSSASPRMPRHEVDDPMTSKKSKLDFCQPPPDTTPASSLPGNQVHNNLHNSQLHLQGSSRSASCHHSNNLIPTANLVCYLQHQSSTLSPTSSSTLSPPSQLLKNNSFINNNNKNTSSPNSNGRQRNTNNYLALTSPNTGLKHFPSGTSPLSSPETTNCGCGFVCSSLGCNSSKSSPSPSPYCLSLSSRAKVKPINTQDLASMISSSSSLPLSKPYLIIDVRSSDSYNSNHIKGALNLSCDDAFNRRRIQMGRTSILNILGVRDSGLSVASTVSKRRSRHHSSQTMDIVVYDDHSCLGDLQDPNGHGALCTVISSLLRDGRDVFVLEGGLKRFALEHEDLCGNICRSPDQQRFLLYSPTNHLHEPDTDTNTASQVLPFLYLGNERDAKDLSRLRSLNISYVLNVTSHVPQYHDGQGIRYKRIPASDSAQQDLRQYFEEAIEYIDDARQNNANVLIHCHAGVSRSATVTIAYLLKHTRMAMADAYKFVKGKRSIISPNFNFLGQLLEFEHDLNDGVTPRILQPRLTGIESSV